MTPFNKACFSDSRGRYRLALQLESELDRNGKVTKAQPNIHFTPSSELSLIKSAVFQVCLTF